MKQPRFKAGDRVTINGTVWTVTESIERRQAAYVDVAYYLEKLTDSNCIGMAFDDDPNVQLASVVDLIARIKK